MRDYGQFCPIAQAVEVLGQRWTLLVVRELLCGSTRFSELTRGLPRISRSVLTARLHELQAAGLVCRTEEPDARHVHWRLTEAGLALGPLVTGIGTWSQVHLRREVAASELDVGLLMWDVRRSVRPDALGPPPVVVKFHFTDAPVHERTFWLVRREEGVELCLTDPLAPADATIHADIRTLVEVWIGRRALADAIASGDLRVTGGPVAARIGAWIGLSRLAPAGLAAAAT